MSSLIRKIFLAFVFCANFSAYSEVAVDIDLTKMNPIFLYAQIVNMLKEPEVYDGKTVRMKGMFSVFSYNEKRSYNCIIQDATACCAQGLPFELSTSFSFPEDYPERGEEIIVRGTFHIFREKDFSRVAIINSEFE